MTTILLSFASLMAWEYEAGGKGLASSPIAALRSIALILVALIPMRSRYLSLAPSSLPAAM